MDKEEIFIILQCCVFAFEVSEADVIALGYNPRLVRIGFKLKEGLEKDKLMKKILNGGLTNGY